MNSQLQLATSVRRGADILDKSFAVMVVGGFDSDLIALLHILSDTEWTLYWNTTLADAVDTLRHRPVSVVLCDHVLPDGGWKGMLEAAASLASPPPLIVTARFASERLWAEVLSLGGHDVLMKPFDADEVIRAVSLAQEYTRAAGASGSGASAA
jgi:DNA-binding response OmpR family regulator